MTEDEVGGLLKMMAAGDRRTIGDTDVDFWMLTIGDLPFEDAKIAIAKHYRESREWLMPADVRRGVKAIQADRLARIDVTDLIPRGEIEKHGGDWCTEYNRRLKLAASGTPVADILAAVEAANTRSAIEGGDR